MNDLNHLKQSVLLRQSGELPAGDASELERLLVTDGSAATFARDAETVLTVYKKTSGDHIPATPDFTMERILREGRRAMAPATFGERFRAPLQWAAAAAILAIVLGAAAIYTRSLERQPELAQSPSTPTLPHKAIPQAAEDPWKTFETDDLDIRLASLQEQVIQVAGGYVDSEEDALARELLLLEKDTIL